MLVRTLNAEWIKYRRTPALLLSVIGPVALTALFALAYALNPQLHAMRPVQKWAWLEEGLLVTWMLLFLPLGATILCALATQLEHADNHLKHILSLPPSRAHVYAAKLTAVFGLVLLGSITLTLAQAGLVAMIGAAVPGPWWLAYSAALKAWVALFPVLTLGVWLGLRWRSFAVALSVGLAGTITGTLAIRSGTYWPFVPWAYPYMATQAVPANLERVLMLSIGLGVGIIVLGMLDFSRRDVV